MRNGFHLLAVLTAAAVLVALWFVARAPVETQMGIVQKIFYFHVPSAYAMYLGVATCCIASIVYLKNKSRRVDALAHAAAEIAVAFCAIVLTTGPLWARKAWGVYWTWDPRLTTTLLLGLVFLSYVLLRAFGEGEAERRFSAAIAALALVIVPVIHFSVQLWRGQHPTVITGRGGGLDPEMRTALLVGFAAFTLLFALLLWFGTRIGILSAKLERLRTRAVEVGVGGVS